MKFNTKTILLLSLFMMFTTQINGVSLELDKELEKALPLLLNAGKQSAVILVGTAVAVSGVLLAKKGIEKFWDSPTTDKKIYQRTEFGLGASGGLALITGLVMVKNSGFIIDKITQQAS